MASTLPRLPIFEAITKHDPSSTAVVHSDSARSFTYGNLLHDVARGRGVVAAEARGESGKDGGIAGERVGFLVENGYDYVVTMLSIMANHAVALPLAGSFPPGELAYILNQSQAIALLSSSKMQDKAEETLKEELDAKPMSGKVEKITESSDVKDVTLQDVKEDDDKGGLMLYTSGTTSRPKGVILNTTNLTAQSHSLQTAWNYTPSDRLLHILPLHHIHGLVNALLTPLFAGSTIEFLFPFVPELVWTRLAAPFLPSSETRTHHTAKDPDHPSTKPITFFTAVPTVYTRLLSSHPEFPAQMQEAAREAVAPHNLRLNISGSAALPTPTKTAWRDLSRGNVLLERFGMTEVGMALSCGLDFDDRVDGSVGWPLPGVQVRLVDTENGEVIQHGEENDVEVRERQGEVQLRGDTVFSGYFRNEAATAEEFVDPSLGDGDGRKWFKTGDVAGRKAVANTGKSGEWTQGAMYFIAGRKSADIIKSGGEKVSALEVERELLACEEVKECAVVGVPSAKWGQKVAAVVVLSDAGKKVGRNKEGRERAWGPLEMRRRLKEKLVAYKCPQEMKVVEEIARNAMGKINKKQLVKDLFADRTSPPPGDGQG